MSFPTPIPTFDCHGRGLNRRRGTRSGLSIVEVLTSIVVAMIGVFGVMVLIPFAVKQAQTGLDSDSAVTVARNAVSQMEIMGMQIPQNWTTGPAAADRYDPPTDPAEIFSLDPLGVTEASFANAEFPFEFRSRDLSSGGFEGDGLPIRAVNFLDSASAPFTSELARRMCRSGDDLVFGEPDDTDPNAAFFGPEQLFDTDGGPGLRRQSQGRISWSAIVVPFTTDPTTTGITRWSYRMYILVYKNRQFTDFISPGDPGGAMAVAQLDTSSALNRDGVHSPLSNVYVAARLEGINRDDWVLLINQDTNLEVGFQKQLGFCRVVNLESGDTQSSLTLDGPDFDFGSSANPTYIVHLKDVVGVYERTFTPEQESNWNISF